MSNGKWTTADIVEMTGRVAIVTGGNSGIGFETAKALAVKGARVILGVRDNYKGADAVHQILKEHPEVTVEMRCLDLASLESIQNFTQEFKAQYERLDLLINNAGLMAIPHQETRDGFEMQFGTNHLGHFALTGLLIDLLIKTPGSRVITVSSGMHERGKINFDSFVDPQDYNKWTAYSQSKLANLLFAYELQRRVEAAGYETISVGAHPGYAATNLQKKGPEMEGSSLNAAMMQVSNTLFAQSAEMGALPILYAASAPEIEGGDYIGPAGFMGMRGYPAKAMSSPESYNKENAKRLWEVSSELTGIQYQALQAVKELEPAIV